MSTFGRDLHDTLYYGDNLEILTRFISDESVDLVYLDPPFNKNAAYSVIFRDESGRTSDAQMATLEDYWHWGPTPARHYEYLTNSAEHRGAVPHAVSALVGALHTAIRPSPLLAYLVEMAVRLVEMRRVLKRTGALYLHCDPTNSHYLKLLLDAIFGPTNFRNEIVWKRGSAHSDTGQGAKHYGRISDTLLFYAVSDENTWNQQYMPYDPDYIAENYKRRDADGRVYRIDNIQGPGGAAKGNPHYEFLGVTRYWRYSRERMGRLYEEGRIVQTRPGAVPQYKRYLDEMPGVPVQNIWTDISPINNRSKELLGYPTQKPVALLERIIATSSNPGDIVLDPFCGCGTALEAAHRLGRRWIGIDISNLAVQVIRDRMRKSGREIAVFDWPTEMDGLRRMAEAPDGKRRFEVWALARLGLPENKRGSDAGMDGRIGFTLPNGKVETIIVSVKGGRHVGSPEVRDLKGAMDRERAMGLLFTLDKPSPAARKEAMESGFYRSPVDGRQYPKLLIFTARELLEEGRLPDLPTRHGFQEPFWPLPAATRSVRLRAVKGAVPLPLPMSPEPVDRAAEQREAYMARQSGRDVSEQARATSPEARRSLRTSKRGR